MSIIFLIFYIVIIITIIANVLKIVKAIKGNNYSMLNNIQNMSDAVQVKSKSNYVNDNNIKQDVVNLDDFMKSNTNPIKEKRRKRSNI